jgi:hypothetical protein
MPYGSFGELRPFTPFSSLIAGVGAGEQVQTNALKRGMMQNALDSRRQEQAALRTYADTGEGKDLLASSPDMWMKLNEDQRKELDSGTKEFKEQAPFLTPENYSSWAQSYQKRHPNLGKLLPPSEQMQTPDQITAFNAKAHKAITDLYAQKSAIDVGAKKELYKDVQLPAMKLEQAFKEKTLGMTADKQLTLQENQQNFLRAENEKKLSLERDMKEAKTTEAREGHFYTNLRFEQAKLNETFLKQMEKVSEAYTGPEKDSKELELRRSHELVNNKILRKYKTWADEYKIPFQEVPEENKPAATIKVSPQDAVAEARRRGLIK